MSCFWRSCGFVVWWWCVLSFPFFSGNAMLGSFAWCSAKRAKRVASVCQGALGRSGRAVCETFLLLKKKGKDAFGHLNNVLYLRYFESARIAYCDNSGWLSESSDIKPILAGLEEEKKNKKKVGFSSLFRDANQVQKAGSISGNSDAVHLHAAAARKSGDDGNAFHERRWCCGG